MWKADANPQKINLGVGAYRDDDGKPVVLSVVRKAEQMISGKENMEYLPMGGLKSMVDASVRLAYGESHEVVKSKRVAAVQSLSGTGEAHHGTRAVPVIVKRGLLLLLPPAFQYPAHAHVRCCARRRLPRVW